MVTSIITTTTFTFATIIDVTLPVSSAGSQPAVTATDDFEITQCMLNALPRCGLAAAKHCDRRSSCKA